VCDRGVRLAIVTAVLVVGSCGASGGLDPETAKLPRSALEAGVDTRLLYRLEEHILSKADLDRNLTPQLARLTPGQRGLVALLLTDAEIQNGGFDQFFWNSSGELADEALAGTRLFGATRYESILRYATAVYPDGEIPERRSSRQRLLDRHVPDAVLRELDERWFATWERDPLDAYVVQYVRRHPDEFFRAG
jgi:hypothetical protein